MQVIAGHESAFEAPLLPNHSSHVCCHERAGWGGQNWVCPRAWEALSAPLPLGGRFLFFWWDFCQARSHGGNSGAVHHQIIFVPQISLHLEKYI